MNDPLTQWVAALRSGKYEQGTGMLAPGDQFCCLGVACEIFCDSGGNLNRERVDDHWEYERNDVLLPEVVVAWLDIGEKSDPEVLFEGSLHDLSDLNDHGWTFDEIATLIEETYGGASWIR